MQRKEIAFTTDCISGNNVEEKEGEREKKKLSKITFRRSVNLYPEKATLYT